MPYLGYGLVSKRLREPALRVEQLPALDAIVLSHMHGDHWDRVAQTHLDRAVPVLTTHHAAKRLHHRGFSEATGLSTWQSHVLTGGAGSRDRPECITRANLAGSVRTVGTAGATGFIRPVRIHYFVLPGIPGLVSRMYLEVWPPPLSWSVSREVGLILLIELPSLPLQSDHVREPRFERRFRG